MKGSKSDKDMLFSGKGSKSSLVGKMTFGATSDGGLKRMRKAITGGRNAANRRKAGKGLQR
mgnify:CR=1 FL=1|tara:strand:+ start:40 stop:222 length:183 start_codon:yes stop_codon:yes gene_type:complete